VEASTLGEPRTNPRTLILTSLSSVLVTGLFAFGGQYLDVLGSRETSEAATRVKLAELQIGREIAEDRTSKIQGLLDTTAAECAAARRVQGEANQLVVEGLMNLLNSP